MVGQSTSKGALGAKYGVFDDPYYAIPDVYFGDYTPKPKEEEKKENSMKIVVMQSKTVPNASWVYDTTGGRSKRDYLQVQYAGAYYRPDGYYRPAIDGDLGKNAMTQTTWNKLAPELPTAKASMEAVQKEMIDKGGAPKPEPKPESLSDKFESALVNAVAQTAKEDLMNQILPDLKKEITEVFGVLPKKIVVKTEYKSKEMEGTLHKEFEKVLALVAADIPVFMTGPAGSGKNHLAHDVARALDATFYFNNALTSEYAVTGFRDANGHIADTEFRRAWTEGGVYMIDEIDSSTPEVLVKLNAALANGYAEFPDGTVYRHKDFRMIAAGNTFGTGADLEYTGRFQLDSATLDRFALIHIDYDPAVEEVIAENDAELLEFIRDFRQAVIACGIKYVVSYRAISRIHKMKEAGINGKDMIRICLTKSLDSDDIKIIKAKMKHQDNRYAQLVA